MGYHMIVLFCVILNWPLLVWRFSFNHLSQLLISLWKKPGPWPHKTIRTNTTHPNSGICENRAVAVLYTATTIVAVVQHISKEDWQTTFGRPLNTEPRLAYSKRNENSSRLCVEFSGVLPQDKYLSLNVNIIIWMQGCCSTTKNGRNWRWHGHRTGKIKSKREERSPTELSTYCTTSLST